MKALGQDVIAQVEALGGSVHLIGHDYGAQMGYEALNVSPHSFKTATFLAVCHPNIIAQNMKRHPLDAWKLRHVFYFSAGTLAEKRVPANNFAYIDTLWKRWSPQLELPEGYLDRVKAMYRDSWPSPVAQYRNMDLTPLTGKFTVPTLQILGAHDGTTSEHTAEGNADLFAGEYSEVTLDNGAHFTHLDAPDEVADLIVNWLRR
ncbi:Alpha/beta hydrolase family protein [Corynebacterium oculi]|uniref:Alpha/beta hydrolase family protein n=2 Tax=Corynebacterium oculi TaxID=1544416 RepID=A0A0Q1ADD2_9CORY|nr:Alpha/beta hydrolase family protein [Corynebacterium oculi]